MISKCFAIAALLAFAAAPYAVNAQDVDWSYIPDDEEALGPADWGEAYADCNGMAQSPIDIPYDGAVADLPEIENAPVPMGECTDWMLQYKGPDFKWNAVEAGECYVEYNGERYNLLQFHMHAPSEHAVNGELYDAEVHFVHANEAEDQFLVIGVFLQGGADEANVFLTEAFTEEMQALEAASVDEKLEVTTSTVDTFYPDDGKWYHYNGSLTTPPCAEAVSWWVAATPVQTTTEQMTLLVSLQDELFPTTYNGENNRPLQEINDRDIMPDVIVVSSNETDTETDPTTPTDPTPAPPPAAAESPSPSPDSAFRAAAFSIAAAAAVFAAVLM